MKTQVVPSPIREEVHIKPFSIALFRDDMERLTREIEKRAYQFFEQRGRENGHDVEDWTKAEQEFLMPVPIQIVEKGKTLNIRAEIPGFSPEELEINLEPQQLTIKGLHETETEETQGFESKVKHIYRTLPLPIAIAPEKATARLRDGVLEINTEKAEPGALFEVKAA